MKFGSENSPLKAAVIGVGYFGRYHCDAWLRIENADIVGICDTDGALAQSVADQYSRPGEPVPFFTDASTMLSSVTPDIATIASPPETHLSLIRTLAQAGVDIIVQTPFCDTLEEAQEAVEIAEEYKVRLVVHTPVRYQPWYREARRLLEDGALGEPYQVLFRFRPGDGRGPRAYLDRHPRYQLLKRFLVQETAIHWIDMFETLFGEATGVFARLTRINPIIKGEDAGYLVFDFANGARGVFDANRLADHAAFNCRLTKGEMLLEGSTGSLRLDGAGRLWRRRFGDIDEREHKYKWRNQQMGGDCMLTCTRSILKLWSDGKEPPTSGRRFLTVKQVVDGAYKSASKGSYMPIGR